MAFLDQISKNLAGYGKEAAKKAKDTAEIFQLKAEIRGEKQKINELYAAIGAVYFKNHREDSEDEYKMFFPEIESAMAHITELEEKIKQLDNTEKCPCCNALVKKGDAFCSKCGAALHQEEAEEEKADVVTEDDFVPEGTAEEPAKDQTEESTAPETVKETETETENKTEEETKQKEEPVSEPEE